MGNFLDISPENWDRILKGVDVGTKIVGGITGGVQNAADRERQKMLDAQARLLQKYNLEAAARGGQADWLQTQLSNDFDRAKSMATQSPLGAEQLYTQQQNLLGNMGRQFSNMAMPTAYGGTVNPLAGLDLSAYSPGATAAALADRRRVLAAINPNMQFSDFSAYGLSGDGVASAQQGATDYAASLAQSKKAKEDEITNLINAQMDAARNFDNPTPPTDQGQAQPKKTSWLKKLGKIGLAVATPVTAALTGGTSIPLMAAVGGLSGMGSAKLSGSSWKSALGQGAIGAGTGALGAKFPAKMGMPTNTAGTAAQRVQQAILNPATMARMAAASTSGPVSNVLSAVAPVLGTRPVIPTRAAQPFYVWNGPTQ